MIAGLLLEEDFLNAQYLHRAKHVKRLFLLLGGMAVIGTIVWLSFGNFFPGLLFFCAAIGGGGVLGEWIVRSYTLPKRLRRIYRQHAGYKSTFTYAWDEDALSAESEIGRGRRPWSHYIKWLENDDIFLLYHSDVLFEIIPKHWFSSPGQLTQFRNVISRIGA